MLNDKVSAANLQAFQGKMRFIERYSIFLNPKYTRIYEVYREIKLSGYAIIMVEKPNMLFYVTINNKITSPFADAFDRFYQFSRSLRFDYTEINVLEIDSLDVSTEMFDSRYRTSKRLHTVIAYDYIHRWISHIAPTIKHDTLLIRIPSISLKPYYACIGTCQIITFREQYVLVTDEHNGLMSDPLVYETQAIPTIHALRRHELMAWHKLYMWKHKYSKMGISSEHFAACFGLQNNDELKRVISAFPELDDPARDKLFKLFEYTHTMALYDMSKANYDALLAQIFARLCPNTEKLVRSFIS